MPPKPQPEENLPTRLAAPAHFWGRFPAGAFRSRLLLKDLNKSNCTLPFTIRRHPDSPICHVVVVVRGQEMVVRCPTYFQTVKWARMECKSYKIPESDHPDDEETDDLPLFLRSDFLRSDNN